MSGKNRWEIIRNAAEMERGLDGKANMGTIGSCLL